MCTVVPGMNWDCLVKEEITEVTCNGSVQIHKKPAANKGMIGSPNPQLITVKKQWASNYKKGDLG